MVGQDKGFRGGRHAAAAEVTTQSSEAWLELPYNHSTVDEVTRPASHGVIKQPGASYKDDTHLLICPSPCIRFSS